MRFQDKVALVTAAASGIGRATAEIMARDGALVIAVDNHEERLDRTVAALREAGGRAERRLCNALDPGEVDATISSIAARFGRIDILVNAVGGSTIIAKSGATVDELSFAEWQQLIDFNLSGTFLFTHAVVPVMKRQHSGKIVNLASIAGRGLSASSSSAYAAAKGGIIAFTRKLAFELGPYGITINAIAPSKTLTERIRPRWEQQSPDDQAAEIERTPLRRLAEAADQAKVICFLASGDADFVTGVTIDVTGGN
jgi:NAD(P)-dependent dehydrogenase (short-subunit alcohol dehydrogenase family)